ncbi:MAG: D-alanyl-D-alanine carboxypeptidase, partial [Vagococcus sp.]
MKHTTRHLRRIACFIAIIFLLIAPFQVQAKSNAFSVNAKAALVVDANSGKILYNQNGDEVLGIASMTKLLSAYLIYEQIELGTISLSDPLPIS